VAACMGGFQSGSMVGLLAAPAMLAYGGIKGKGWWHFSRHVILQSNHQICF
jgi:hypothetical protein